MNNRNVQFGVIAVIAFLVGLLGSSLFGGSSSPTIDSGDTSSESIVPVLSVQNIEEIETFQN